MQWSEGEPGSLSAASLSEHLQAQRSHKRSFTVTQGAPEALHHGQYWPSCLRPRCVSNLHDLRANKAWGSRSYLCWGMCLFEGRKVGIGFVCFWTVVPALVPPPTEIHFCLFGRERRPLTSPNVGVIQVRATVGPLLLVGPPSGFWWKFALFYTQTAVYRFFECDTTSYQTMSLTFNSSSSGCIWNKFKGVLIWILVWKGDKWLCEVSIHTVETLFPLLNYSIHSSASSSFHSLCDISIQTV